MTNAFHIRKDADPNVTAAFRRLLLRYLLVFAFNYLLCTAVILFLLVHLDLHIERFYLNFLLPAIIAYALSLIFFRPLVKALPYREKTIDGLLWLLIPYSLFFPVSFSQPYFRDVNYRLITVDKPSDVLKYPGERFFELGFLAIEPNDYAVFRERHTEGRYGHTLVLTDYYVIPLFDDSPSPDDTASTAVGCGISISTSMDNVRGAKKKQPAKIQAFNRQSVTDYWNYDFGADGYFEVASGTDDGENFAAAAGLHPKIDHTKTAILIHRSGAIRDLHKDNLRQLLWSTGIGLVGALLLFILIHAFRQKDKI